jgi:hypothetical protein
VNSVVSVASLASSAAIAAPTVPLLNGFTPASGREPVNADAALIALGLELSEAWNEERACDVKWGYDDSPEAERRTRLREMSCRRARV